MSREVRMALMVVVLTGIAMMFAGFAIDALARENLMLWAQLVPRPREDEADRDLIEGECREVTGP